MNARLEMAQYGVSTLTSCAGNLRSFRIEPPEFAGVDLSDGHLDGVFALADFLVVLAIPSFARGLLVEIAQWAANVTKDCSASPQMVSALKHEGVIR